MAAETTNVKACQASTFCVTGGTGFVASWLVKRLLHKGYTVHATARHPENEARVRHLLEIPGAVERLKLFRAELLEDGSFDAAVAGCHGVFHVASPVDFAPKDPENDVIRPAVEGTLSVLRACTKSQTVKRVVVTSSAATFMNHDPVEQNRSVDESRWTDVDSLRTKKPPSWEYAVSKILAERAALQYGKEYGLDVVTIVPVLVVGSSITPDVPDSVQAALSLITGIPYLLQRFKGFQTLAGCIPLVHVDDLSSAHIFLMENPSAEGRYICCSINTSVPHLARYAASLGFGGLFCSQDVGGSELSRADGAVIFEALAYGDVSTTAYLSVHNMCCSIIDRYGTEDQRKLWLPQLTRMDLLASYCLTEPCSGSDAASLQTSAKQVAGSGEYILNGTKAFISGGGASDLYLVMARTGVHKTKGISCFLLEKGMRGLSFGCPENKLGWRCQPTTTVIMEDVRVPATNLVGSEGLGLSIALGALDGGRINIAACSVGGAQFCVDATQEYVQTRKQFGKALIDFQNTQFKLADMLTTVHASRLMVAHAASSLDAKDPGATASVAMAKRFATDASYNVSNDALQLHGGYGYLKDYPVERYLRDLRVCTIVEGTNEIMRMVITKQMMKT